MRRVTLVMDELGVSAIEGTGPAVFGHTAAEALASWVFANRDSLGLSLEIATRTGVLKAPAQVIDMGDLQIAV